MNTPIHILVVEDDGAIRCLIADGLKRAGFKTDVAEDGVVAWDALLMNHYQLLITDNTMPKITGFELLKKVRASRMELPVIMATGTLPEREFANSPWITPDATLLKPFTIAELLEKVNEVLRANETTGEQTLLFPNL